MVRPVERLRIAHIVRGLEPQLGGPPRAVAALTTALDKLDVDSTIFATEPRTASDRLITAPDARVRLFPGGWLSAAWPGHSPEMAKELRRTLDEFDLVHVHELWHHPNYSSIKAATALNVPFVVSPLGGYASTALRKARLKKLVFNAIVQRNDLSHTSAFHAMTEHEADDIRKEAPGASVRVIPLGIDFDQFTNLPSPDEFDRLRPELKSRRVVLFLGRLNAIKGLDILIEGFKIAAENQAELHLVVAGPDDGYEQSARRLVRDLGLDSSVSFVGPIYGDDKLAALSRADVFALTSRGEGFSVAILEALAASLPVIISEECHFPEISTSGAGAEIRLDAADFALALTSMMDDPERLAGMRSKARAMAEGPFSWDTIGREFKRFYEENARPVK